MHPPRSRPIFVPAQAPPQGPPPSPAILATLGEAGVVRMLEDFYALLEDTPLRPMFPADMRAAAQRSASFFVQLLGGPPRYSQRYGPPRMRQRHEPFEIDAAARALWLATFERVLEGAVERYGFPREHLPGFRAFLHSFSGWMVNAE
jgi:hemoglobin